MVVLLGLGLYADFGSLRAELASFRWELFPLALALTALNYLLRFFRWQRYLAKLEIEVPPRRSFAIFVAGLTMTITPAKLGELLKSGLLKRTPRGRVATARAYEHLGLEPGPDRARLF